MHMKITLVLMMFLFEIPMLFAQQSLNYEKDKIILNNFLLNGDLQSVDHYFRKKDSIYAKNYSIPDNSHEFEIYTKLKETYSNLIRKIENIYTKSVKELEQGYSAFINSPSDYEKTLLNNNSILTFKRFESHIAKGNIHQAAKFLIITLFLNREFKEQAQGKFRSKLTELDVALKKNNFEKALSIENQLDSLLLLLPDSSKVIKMKYKLLEDELNKKKHEESIKLIAFQKGHSERKFTLNFGLYISHSSENSVVFTERYSGPNEEFNNKKFNYSYRIRPNAGVGLSFAIDYNIFNLLYLGIDYNIFKYKYERINVLIDFSYHNNLDWEGLNSFSFTDISIVGQSYHIYFYYKFPNITIFHPFIKIAYGKAYTDLSGTLPKDPTNSEIFYNEALYNVLHKGSNEYNELEYSLGIEVLKIISNKILVSFAYSRDIKFGNSEWAKITAGKFELNIGYGL